MLKTSVLQKYDEWMVSHTNILASARTTEKKENEKHEENMEKKENEKHEKWEMEKKKNKRTMLTDV